MKNFLFEHPVILGGIIPMLLFGLMTFPIKILNGKLHFSYYILFTGIGVTLVGILAIFLFSNKGNITLTQLSLSIVNGLLWGTVTLLIFLALRNPTATISQLSPLYNGNTLIAMIIGLLFFAEWQNIVVWKTILGALLIILGGWFVL